MTKLLFNIILLFQILFFINYVIPWIYTRFNRYSLKRFFGKSREVYITFDDGPGSRLTPQLLELLDKYHAKATFFLLGRNIPGRETFVGNIVSHGHAIASHGHDHLHAWKKMPWQIVSDIEKGNLVLDQATGGNNRKYPFRPPYGKICLISWIYLLLKNIPICFWTIDSRDTWPDKKKDVLLAAHQVVHYGGGVILFHDFDRPTDENDQYVLDSVEHVLNECQRMGLVFGTISDISPPLSNLSKIIGFESR